MQILAASYSWARCDFISHRKLGEKGVFRLFSLPTSLVSFLLENKRRNRPRDSENRETHRADQAMNEGRENVSLFSGIYTRTVEEYMDLWTQIPRGQLGFQKTWWGGPLDKSRSDHLFVPPRTIGVFRDFWCNFRVSPVRSRKSHGRSVPPSP